MKTLVKEMKGHIVKPVISFSNLYKQIPTNKAMLKCDEENHMGIKRSELCN